MSPWLTVAVLSVGAIVAGCFQLLPDDPVSDGGAPTDAAPMADATLDASPDAPIDAGVDAPIDAGADGPILEGDADAGPIETTYYVSASHGSDSNAGTSSAPWRTIQRANGSAQPGDTIIVQAGTYEAPIFGWDTPPCQGKTYCAVTGTEAHPIVFEADPGAPAGSVVLSGANPKNKNGFDLEPGCDYVDIVGFTVNGGAPDAGARLITRAGIFVGGSRGNRIVNNTTVGISGIGILVSAVEDALIEGNTATGATRVGSFYGDGIYASANCNGVTILGNVLHDNAHVGVYVDGDIDQTSVLPGVAEQLAITGNRIYSNGSSGIYGDGMQISTIENNVIYGNAGNGIDLLQVDAYGGSALNHIVNNTIDESQTSGSHAISIVACKYAASYQPIPAGCSAAPADTSTGNIAFDNVLLGGAGPTTVVSSSDLATSTNITTATSGLFVNRAAGDYRLAPDGGGVGTGVGAFQGVAAPDAGGGGYDIGAFSFPP